MHKNRALIFDVDGTAIDSPSQKLPTPRLYSAVKAVESHYFVCAATGRPWSFAKPILQGMGLVDPCIVAGGTQICDPRTGEVIWECAMARRSVEAVKKVLVTYPEYDLIINDYNEEQYFNAAFPAKELNVNQDIFFANCLFIPPKVAHAIARKLDAIEDITVALGTSQKPGRIDVLITNQNATKEHAIAELLTRLGVDRANTYGFGDGLNDTHLFNAVHTKVAMGNAVPKLKDAADEVIQPVSKDGLAHYFERLASEPV